LTSSWLIVLNWNGRDDTLELLESLADARLDDTTVLVVDNGSTDGTLEAVAEQHPWARTLQTGANLGYAGGNNAGIRLALSQGAAVVGVLNNDTYVDPGFWAPLVATASESAVAVSPDIRYVSNPEVSWFFGGIVSVHDGRAVRHLQPDEQPRRDQPFDSETLTGCCLVANAETWRTVGLFDDGLFLIFEDADWSLRAKRKGVRLVVTPESRISHKVSRSFQGKVDGLGRYYFCRNGLIFTARWLGPAATARFLWVAVIRAGLSTLRHEPSKYRGVALSFVAALAAAGGRRGPAGRWVTRIAGV
jgi:GT2 family glycosyltransferase